MEEIKNRFERYDRYKASGVEWLGEIPEEWTFKKLKYLAKIFNGDSLNEGLKKKFSSKNKADYAYISSKNVNVENSLINYENGLRIPVTETQFKTAKINSSLLCIEGGSAGKKIAFTNQITCFVNKLAAFEAYESMHSKFLFYSLKAIPFQTQFKLGLTGLIGGVAISLIKNFQVITPIFSVQTAIANFLDDKTAKIDKAIAQKEKLITLLKERKQIIIQDAVTGKWSMVNGQWLPTPPEKMKDSGVEWIGQIPEGWEVKRLKFVLKTQGRIGFKGYTTSDLVDKENGALTLGASHMDWDGNINLDKPVYISWKKYYESPEIMVSKGDLLIVQRGSTCGKVVFVKKKLGPTTINPSLVLLKEINQYYKYVFLGIKVVLNGILNIVSNTAIPMLSQFQIDNISIAVPPKKEQVAIVNYVNSRSAKIDKAVSLQVKQIAKLKEYKATLIDSAVTGKIRINC